MRGKDYPFILTLFFHEYFGLWFVGLGFFFPQAVIFHSFSCTPLSLGLFYIMSGDITGSSTVSPTKTNTEFN